VAEMKREVGGRLLHWICTKKRERERRRGFAERKEGQRARKEKAGEKKERYEARALQRVAAF
jgi:hypothetical protein